MGFELGSTAHRKEFWTRTGLNTISSSWIDNGYRIIRMHLEDRPRIVFGLKKDEIREAIQLCKGLVGFEYEGKEGNVDPYYFHDDNTYEYLLFYNGEE